MVWNLFNVQYICDTIETNYRGHILKYDVLYLTIKTVYVVHLCLWDTTSSYKMHVTLKRRNRSTTKHNENHINIYYKIDKQYYINHFRLAKQPS